MRSLDDGNLSAAVGELQAFQYKVLARLSDLDAAFAQSLIDAAVAIINTISG